MGGEISICAVLTTQILNDHHVLSSIVYGNTYQMCSNVTTLLLPRMDLHARQNVRCTLI
jgi:hypothetical protein